jgi:hypothetical protein
MKTIRLSDVQLNPHLLDSAGVTTLARLAHEAEEYEPHGDDVTQMHIDSVLTFRGPDEYELFRREYMRLLRDRAKQPNNKVSDERL